MKFRDPPGRKPEENLLPMINVVFLLLIFFLISARLTPPEPFSVAPPEARAAEEARGDFNLFLSASGQIGFRDVIGEDALVAVTAAKDDYCRTSDCMAEPAVLTLRADAGLEAAELAQLMPRLATMGFTRIELVATERVE